MRLRIVNRTVLASVVGAMSLAGTSGLVRAQDAIRVTLPPQPHHKLERV